MPKTAELPRLSVDQQGVARYKEDVVHFQDDVSAFRITGRAGVTFDFNTHTYRPTKSDGYAIVYTNSNDYLIFTHDGQTKVVEFGERGAEAVYANSSLTKIPQVEFGAQWKITDTYETPGVVTRVLLLYKAYADQSVGVKMDGPSPFYSYVRRLNKPMRWCQLSDPDSSPHYMP